MARAWPWPPASFLARASVPAWSSNAAANSSVPSSSSWSSPSPSNFFGTPIAISALLPPHLMWFHAPCLLFARVRSSPSNFICRNGFHPLTIFHSLEYPCHFYLSPAPQNLDLCAKNELYRR